MSDLETVSLPICKEKMKRLEDRIDKVESITDEIRKLTLSVERLTITVQNMVAEQEAQKERLQAIESKDGEMWRSIVKYAVTAIFGAFLGYALKNIGF